MRALTLTPPWGDVIIYGDKRVENRTWGQNVRGVIAIHRGGKGGALLGLVEVLDVVSVEVALRRYPGQRKHIQGPLCWLLDNVRAFASPVPCRGMLSLWQVPDELWVAIRAQNPSLSV